MENASRRRRGYDADIPWKTRRVAAAATTWIVRGERVAARAGTRKLETGARLRYFSGAKRLMPKPSDLSYYNWETQTSTHNSTPNFQVVADADGLLFKNKRDRKVVNVDPKQNPGDNSSRNELKTDEYLQVVIFDHLTRRKN